MISEFHLKIRDENLAQDYNKKRAQEITPICIGICAYHIILNLLIGIISIIFNWNEYIIELWLGRIIGIVINVILVILLFKYPVKLVPYMAALIAINELCFLLMKLNHSKDNMPSNPLLSSIAQLSNTLIYGLLINSNWIITSVSILIVTCTTFSYQMILLKQVDYFTISIFANTIIFLTIAIFYLEKRSKIQFLENKQISQLNEELRMILTNLPVGVLLVNEESKNVSLQNQEIIRIFQLSNVSDPNIITEMVKQQSVTIYSDSTCDTNKTNRSTGDEFKLNEEGFEKINILSAAVQPEGQSFQVLKNNNSIENSIPEQQEIVTFKLQKIPFQNTPHLLIMVSSITNLIKNEKIKLQNHFLEMLTSTVSHDMRTPLNSILGIGKNLQPLIQNLQGQRFLSIMMNSARILHYLINDLIDIFRIRNGKFSSEIKKVNLQMHLEELSEIFIIQVLEKNLKFYLEFDPSLPKEITLDIQRVKQILISLIGNSLKFTFHGFISLRAEIGFKNDRTPVLQLIVRDSGIGIKDEDKQQIFKVLGKIDATANNNTSGVGLGLSTCKKIVEALGGSIFFVENKQKIFVSVDDIIIEDTYITKSQTKERVYTNNNIQYEEEHGGTAIAVQISCPELAHLFPKVESKMIDESSYSRIQYDSNDETASPFKYKTDSGFNPNNIIETESNKADQYSSSRPLQQDDFLHQNLTTLVATKKKNLKQKKPQMIRSTSSKQTLIVKQQFEHLSCSCQDRREILVVDDNIFNIVTLQTILECSLKLQTDKALNGKEAVEKVMKRAEEQKQSPCSCKRKNTNYKLIFMDCNMPIMDGIQATFEIRKTFSTKEIHIAALTAYASEQFEKKCRAAGMDSFLTKPINDEKIFKLIEELNILF